MNKLETISERIIPQNSRDRPEFPEWVCEDSLMSTKDGALPPSTKETASTEIEVDIVNTDSQTVRAKRFLQLVAGTKEEAGLVPWRAARALGTTIGDLMRGNDIKASVKKLLETGHLPAAIRKEMVRSGLNKVFLENIDGSLKEQKVAIDAAKVISQDPEVGLNIAPTSGVTIDLGSLGKLIDNMKPIPGLEKLMEEKDDSLGD